MTIAANPTADLAHRSLTVGEVRLHWVEAGRGSPVLLIPGWPQDWYAWRHVVPLLVAAGRRAVVLDPRGLGESGKTAGSYDLDTVSAEVHGFLTEAGLLDKGGIDVVAHDLGSWVAYALASAHPEDVRRLVVSEVTVPTPDAARSIPDEATNVKTWHFAFNRLANLPEALVAGRERVFLDWLFDNKAARPAAIDADAREHYACAFAAPGAARAGFEYYRSLFSGQGLRRMAERLATPLAMPVLTIGADGGVGDRLAESLGGSALDLHRAVLTGGHYLPEEAPAAFAQAVLDFWRDTAAAAG